LDVRRYLNVVYAIVIDAVDGWVNREEVMRTVDAELGKWPDEVPATFLGVDRDLWGATPDAQESQMRVIEMFGGLVDE
jgi:hypothetical protein